MHTLRTAIQTLCQSSNPLGRCLEFVQEVRPTLDLTSMPWANPNPDYGPNPNPNARTLTRTSRPWANPNPDSDPTPNPNPNPSP